MKCIKVNSKDAENVRLALIKNNLINKNYKILRYKNFVYLPVNSNKVNNFKVINKNLKKTVKKSSFLEILKNSLSKKELKILSNAFDIIGSIAVLEINSELLHKKKFIADAILKSNNNIKTVVRKLGSHEGEYRTQSYEYLAGRKTFKTVHRESNIKLNLDISKVYFSPRLANERLRIARLVKDNERVLVMFSGIGAYCFVISKYSKAKEVYGIEINPDACIFAEENIKLNKLKNVKLYCGDVRKIIPELNVKFDRIIMPLPKTSVEFSGLAAEFVKNKGIIHIYSFCNEDKIEEYSSDIVSRIKSAELINVTKCGKSKPHECRICIDLKFKK